MLLGTNTAADAALADNCELAPAQMVKRALAMKCTGANYKNNAVI